MNYDSVIRPASAEEIDEMVAIDDDAGTLFELAGLDTAIGHNHPYSLEERACWVRCVREGNAFLIASQGGPPLGMVIMDRVDGAPYLEQLSVRRNGMGQGIGSRLLWHAIEWAGREPLWLTTYAHVPWNRPFYERYGFVAVRESECSARLQAILAEQRLALPAPEQRIAMIRTPAISRASSVG